MISLNVRKWALFVLVLFVSTNILLIMFRYVARYVYGLEPFYIMALVLFGGTYTILVIVRLILDEILEIYKLLNLRDKEGE